MTQEEFEILTHPALREAIDKNINRDVVQIALDKHLDHASLIATQVKRLQRAKTKLPSYYSVRAILPPRAYEQSSSELCAAKKRLSGQSVADLTCGLGIDTLALSGRFKRVVSCERDAILSQITRYNLALLGVDNVEVVTCSAEEYLEQCTEQFDWIFIDPDRRGERGEKLVKLEECSPNVIALLPLIKQHSKYLCIKCSPLFDTAQAERIFGPCTVETISIASECKEVNIYLDNRTPTLAAEAIGLARFEIAKEEVDRYCFSQAVQDISHYKYLILPDVALVHSRLTAAAFAGKADIWSHNGVALALEAPQAVLGRTFEIGEVYPLGSKELKKRLKGAKVEIFSRDIPLSNNEIKSKFSLRTGADSRWCFTRICGKMYAIELKRQIE